MIDRQIDDIFPHRMIIELFNAIKGKIYIQRLSDKVGASISHVRNTLDRFEENGLINRKKDGRVIFVTLTKKGEDLQKDLKITLELFNEAVKRRENGTK